VVITPPPAQQRQHEILAALVKEHGAFVQKMLFSYKRSIATESTQDLALRVIMVLVRRVEADRAPLNPRGFLVKTIRYVLDNHRKLARRAVDRECEVDAFMAEANDPEEEAALAEWREKLARYLERLPQELFDVVRCLDFEGMTLEATAEELDRTVSKVFRLHKQALETLREMVAESARETELGLRRRAR
jgi:RNA polymerase sigma factor (sigma-70 family)